MSNSRIRTSLLWVQIGKHHKSWKEQGQLESWLVKQRFSHLKNNNLSYFFFSFPPPPELFLPDDQLKWKGTSNIQPNQVCTALLVGGPSYGMVLILGSNTLSVRKQEHFISARKRSSTTSILEKKKKQIPCSRLKGEKPKEIRKKIRKLLLMARFNSYLKVGERAVTYTFIFKLIQER